MKTICAIVLVLTAGLSTASWAAMRQVTLSVPGMTCPTCPITIRKALDKVDGVSAVKSNVDEKTVTVTYDDAKTTPAVLTKATANAGYPSTAQH